VIGVDVAGEFVAANVSVYWPPPVILRLVNVAAPLPFVVAVVPPSVPLPVAIAVTTTPA
jgi:hypothetical protein